MRYLSRLRRAQRLLLAVTAAIGLPGCGTEQPVVPTPISEDVSSEVVVLDPSAAGSVRILTGEVTRHHAPEWVEVTGRVGVDENRTSRVGTIADGRIQSVHANVGDAVVKGQLLARLHSREVHEARAEYAKAKTELARRRDEAQFATKARDRALRLYELKAASLEQVQRAEMDLRNAELGISLAQADVHRAGEHLHHLGLTAEGTEEKYTRASVPGEFEEDELILVVSPIDGSVLERFVSPGAVVTPADDLFLVSDLRRLWVTAEVSERHLASLELHRPVEIRVQAYGDRKFRGSLALIGDTLNPDTRTVQVRCTTVNENQLLKVGMYATVRFEIGAGREAILIPADAIQDVGGQSVVFVRESENRYRLRPVRTGRRDGDRQEVLEGLQPGEQVVFDGSFVLKSELLKRQIAAE